MINDVNQFKWSWFFNLVFLSLSLNGKNLLPHPIILCVRVHALVYVHMYVSIGLKSYFEFSFLGPACPFGFHGLAMHYYFLFEATLVLLLYKIMSVYKEVVFVITY